MKEMKPHPCSDRRDIPAFLKIATQKLKDGGFKLTKPRRALLKAVTTFTAPFSTEESFVLTKKFLRASGIDLVTVYRGLSTFEALDIITRVDLGDGVVRYELIDPGGHHHHHFICQGCAKIEPLKHCELKEQEAHLKAAGYSRLSHRLEFFGFCPSCAKLAKPEQERHKPLSR